MRRVLPTLVSSILLLAACGGSADDELSAAAGGAGAAGAAGGAGGTGGTAGSSGAGGNPAAEMDAACSASAAATCEKREACRAGEATRLWGSVDACTARTKAACVAGLAAPDAGATAATTTACAASITSASCTDWLSPKPLAGCGPYQGKRVDGAACTYGAQCTSGTCQNPSGGLCGACAPLPKAGDPCGDNVGCGATDLKCDTDTMKCMVPSGAGAACGKGLAPCGTELSCIGATATKQGACTADATTVGAACDPKSETAPDCDKAKGLYCDKTTKKCAQAAVAQPGSPCGAVGDLGTICTGGSVCIVPSGTKTGTCTPLAKDGAACDTTLGPTCLAPARCVITSGTAGTCQLPDATKCP